ncbi:MAG TPA: cbb3-type cytochrome c oxidase subunit I [Geminicoccaceae bacterium]|nr:cbb3-type cytochrome c oxidase subunit I [Geminicoccus sp.]HMU50643.1 cbb3-type cytochrome c oxidase subunit I [Geminicoccaceae bacterium]
MRYPTQKIAFIYFTGALVLFLAQVTFGVLAGFVYVWPNFVSELLPFNIIRMIHTNALIVWLLLGFFGATYYLLPEEAERDIESPLIAKVQFWLFFGAAGVAVVGYLFRIHEGREFLEQPIYVKLALTAAILLFLYNISMTVLRGRKTAVSSVLLLGLWGAGVFFLFAFYNPGNLVVDKIYWWWVVHIWVEGVWELIMAAILAYLLIKVTGVDREVVEKWLYIIVGLSLFTGLLGTGHHYYWIGTPGYWQWLGSVFSTFEIAPFFAMVIWAFMLTYRGGREHANRAALLWSLGCPVVAFFGAGVWGFMHTLSFVNYYSHGTQVTAAHGHLAFYGAYVMLNLAIITYAMPALRGLQPYNQQLNMWSFWIMTSAMAFMTFTLTFAGVIQTHMQRVVGGYSFMDVQDQLALFYWMRLGAGVMFSIGAAMFVYAVLGPVREQLTARDVRGDAGGLAPAE